MYVHLYCSTYIVGTRLDYRTCINVLKLYNNTYKTITTRTTTKPLLLTPKTYMVDYCKSITPLHPTSQMSGMIFDGGEDSFYVPGCHGLIRVNSDITVYTVLLILD